MKYSQSYFVTMCADPSPRGGSSQENVTEAQVCQSRSKFLLPRTDPYSAIYLEFVIKHSAAFKFRQKKFGQKVSQVSNCMCGSEFGWVRRTRDVGGAMVGRGLGRPAGGSAAPVPQLTPALPADRGRQPASVCWRLSRVLLSNSAKKPFIPTNQRFRITESIIMY